jgi:hypothetical protein
MSRILSGGAVSTAELTSRRKRLSSGPERRATARSMPGSAFSYSPATFETIRIMQSRLHYRISKDAVTPGSVSSTNHCSPVPGPDLRSRPPLVNIHPPRIFVCVGNYVVASNTQSVVDRGIIVGVQTNAGPQHDRFLGPRFCSLLPPSKRSGSCKRDFFAGLRKMLWPRDRLRLSHEPCP